MSTLLPYVRHMLICEDARPRPGKPHKIDLFGLINSVRVASIDVFPARINFCVYIVLTEGRGSGEGRVVVFEADSSETSHVGRAFPITFDPNPLKAKGILVRIANCALPAPGLYLVEFRYNEVVLAREPILVEVRP